MTQGTVVVGGPWSRLWGCREELGGWDPVQPHLVAFAVGGNKQAPGFGGHKTVKELWLQGQVPAPSLSFRASKTSSGGPSLPFVPGGCDEDEERL